MQMTFAEFDVQVLAKQLARRSGGGFHQIVEAWSDSLGRNNGFGWYLEVGPSLDWASAWQDRELFTFVPDTTVGNKVPYGHSDFRMLVSNDDDVHAFYEAKFYPPDSIRAMVAYKRRGGVSWDSASDPVFLAPGCVSDSPRPYYDSETDIMHLMFTAAATTGCYPAPPSGTDLQVYTRKAVSAADSAWAPLTYMYPSIGLGPIGGGVFAEADTVHFFGSRTENQSGWKVVTVIHRSGLRPPPASTGRSPTSIRSTLFWCLVMAIPDRSPRTSPHPSKGPAATPSTWPGLDRWVRPAPTR
ncbi:MAG: hypothetical protein R3B81_00755 [bacterium]